MPLFHKIKNLLLRRPGQIHSNWNDLLDHAGKAAGQADAEPSAPPAPPPSLGSELDKHPGFWSRAEQFIRQSKPPDPSPPTEGRPTLRSVLVEKRTSAVPVKGMEDLDHDGNPLFDDAIILPDDGPDPSG
ncbi:MAG: hypothetical protein RLY31_2268 [Bacteroidota bacterium]|jgi:hypothetical protein